MRRNGYAADALIGGLLRSVQRCVWLSDEPLKYVAHSLNVPLSKVYGVATFYHFVHFAKVQYVLRFGTGTAVLSKARHGC